MPLRQQLTVASPLGARTLIAAALDALTRRDRAAQVRDAVAREFAAREVVLTDSGTSALVLALRMLAHPTRPVALPAYACVDLIAAARRANVRVLLYDVDLDTLSPNLDSVARVVAEGVSAIVVAHLYGFPADVVAVREIARQAGVPIIEDAAQHAGATLHGAKTGSLGDLTVLSFGRGKGTTAGRGGAVLAHADDAAHALSAVARELSPAIAPTDLLIAWASWALGRPWLYALPASIPALHLGETTYHEAADPELMSRTAVALLARTLPTMHEASTIRRRNALALRAAAEQSRRVDVISPVEGGDPGYLRFPILLRSDTARIPSRLGVARGYPRALSLEAELQPLLNKSHEPLHGAHNLGRRLVTLPTHHFVTASDLKRLASWMRSA